MGEEVQHPHAPRHLQLWLDLQGGLHPQPIVETDAVTIGKRGSHARRRRQRERLNGEGGGHVLCPSGVDLTGGDEHEPDLAAGVEELEGTVVVRERGAVRVPHGGVLGKREVDGAVCDREWRKLDGADGDLGVLRLKHRVVDYEDDDDDED